MRVTFWTGRADALGDAQRLLLRWVQAGLRVRVVATPAGLRVLDRHLWLAEPGGFVPHRRTAPSATAADAVPPGIGRTPIWLGGGPIAGDAPTMGLALWFAAGAAADDAQGADGAAAPHWEASIERVVELVGVDPDSVAQGRRRWNGYRQQGVTPEHHAAGERAG